MSPLAHPKGKTPSRSCNLRKGVFEPSGMPKPLPLGEVARHRRDGEGKPVSREPPRSDRQALCRSDTIAVQSCLAASLPSQSGLRPPAPPKGEPLAGRVTLHWTPEARYGAKGRALLQRAAARPDMAQKGGPCYRGQQLLDNAPCQAAAALDSGALQPTKRINFARSVGT